MAVIGNCKLCLRANIELRDSHLLSKAAYKILRKSQNGDSPIMVDREIALVTDSQIRAHVLCEICEDRLNKYGEGWVLRHCHRGGEGFRLRELLFKTQPEYQSDDLTVYAAAKIAEIEVDKLVYFATSVFWRSCCHGWRAGMGSPSQVSFGRQYQDELRSYLIGSGCFPHNAALCVHVTSDALAGFMSVPNGGRVENYWRYDFHLLGIGFTLWLGALIPKGVRQLCLVKSPGRVILSGDAISDMIINHEGKLFCKTRPIGSLAGFIQA